MGDHGTVPAPDAGIRTRSAERVVFFSDAVLAIALTLLAIDLPLPPRPPAAPLSNAQLWDFIGEQLHEDYLSFAISFGVIAVFWTMHRRVFDLVLRADGTLVWLNMAFLFAIVVLPYFTRLDNADGGDQPGTILYAAVVAVIGASLAATMGHAYRAGLLDPGASVRHVRRLVRALAVVTAAFLVSIPLAFVDASAARWTWLVIPVVANLILRIVRRGSAGRDPAS